MPDQTHSTLIRVFLGVLLLLLGYALSVAARTALADAYAEPAKSYLQGMRDADEVLNGDQWGAVFAALDRALALAPGDPRNLSELGRLYRTLLESDTLNAEQILRFGDTAAGYYQAALVLRPTWPWDWGNLALVKYQQYQDVGSEYQDALVRAVRFGPRETSLQERVVELGTESWPILRPDAASAVLRAADRALERDAQSFPEMADQVEQWRPLCTKGGDDFTHFKRRCEAAGLKQGS